MCYSRVWEKGCGGAAPGDHFTLGSISRLKNATEHGGLRFKVYDTSKNQLIALAERG